MIEDNQPSISNERVPKSGTFGRFTTPITRWREFTIIGVVDGKIYISDDLMNLPKSFEAYPFPDNRGLIFDLPEWIRNQMEELYRNKALRTQEEQDLSPMLRVRCVDVYGSPQGWDTLIELPFDGRTCCDYEWSQKGLYEEDRTELIDMHNATSVAVYGISNCKEFIYALVYGEGVRIFNYISTPNL